MKQAGSVTVFFVLLIVGIASAVFAFLEAARVSALKSESKLCAAQAADAVRASYQPDLWADYHLLFWEEGKIKDGKLPGICTLQTETIEKNRETASAENALSHSFFFLQVHLNELEVTGYQLASDDAGAAFRRQAADRMKEELASEAIDSLRDIVTGSDPEQLERSGEAGEAQAEDAAKQLDEMRNGLVTEGAAPSPPEVLTEENTALPAETGTNLPANAENPLEWMRKIKKEGILALVMPERAVSAGQIDLSQSAGRRKLQTGTWQEDSAQAADNLLFHLYCESKFKNVLEEQERADENGLNYEMEYLVGGKASDEANMKAVVRRLLLMREGSNLLYLEQNAQKSQEAYAMALTITSAAASPELAEPVKHAILAAWAYAESISDVRILLAGGSVSLVKTDAQWHTQLGQLGTSISETEAKQQKEGLSYHTYLQILLWTVSEDRISERAMTILEQNTDVKMDELVGAVCCSYQFAAQPLFWNFVQLGNNSPGTYKFRETGQIIYGKTQ